MFHHAAHLQIQAREGWISFLALHPNTLAVAAFLHVWQNHGEAISPARASFGSIAFQENMPPKVLYQFITFITTSLHKQGIKKLTLTNPPDAYKPHQAALLNTFLLNQGFQVEKAEVSMVLNTTEAFTEHLSAWEKRRLRQGHEAGLTCQEEPLEALVDIYQFILACREERNYPLSIQLDTLQETVNAFPERFTLFSVYHKAARVAAAITIAVAPHVLYNFHAAHPRRYDFLSPVVVLTASMHQHARQRGFTLLDLGTSAVAGAPNFGLLDFKRHLGGSPSMKLTFVKQW